MAVPCRARVPPRPLASRPSMRAGKSSDTMSDHTVITAMLGVMDASTEQ